MSVTQESTWGLLFPNGFRTKSFFGRSEVKKLGILAAFLMLAAAVVVAHPHIQKSVSVQLDGGAEVKLAFYTSPANMEHVKNAAAGDFKGGARLSVSADIKSGDTTIPAGEYTVGAVKKDDGHWKMALYPGKLGYGESADTSKLLELKSVLDKDHGTADHVSFDLVPGSGDLDGHLTLVWHFGPLRLSGALN